MEPLSITCDTCSARLKVRDPAAIGQILSCPKCQSMVLVEAPVGWQADGDGDAAEGVEAAAPPLPEQQGEASAPTESFEDDALLDESLSEPSLPSQESTLVESNPEAMPQGELPELAMPATTSLWSRWMASSVGRWSIIGGAAAAAMFVGLIGWSVLGGKNENGEQVAQQEQTPPEVADQKSPDQSPRAGDDDKSEAADGGDPQAETPDNPFAQEPSGDPNTTPTVDDSGPGDQIPFDNGPTDASPKKPEPEKPDPLEPIVDPGTDDTKEPEDPAAGESSTDLLAGMDLLDEGELFGIGSGFGLPGEPEKPQDEPQPPAGIAPVLVDPEDAAHPQERTELPKVDVEAGLSLEMIGAKYQRSRMIDFLETMSDLSGVPITLDLVAVEPLKLGPASRISISKGKTTVGALVEDALKAHHQKLDLVRSDDGLVISAVAADRRLKIDHPVDDLAPAAADRTALIELLQSLVPATSWLEPDGSLRVTDNGSELVVDQPMQVQYEVIVFLEKLRTARNKPSRNRFYDAGQFTLASRSQQAAPKLNKAIDVNVVIREPLAKVVRKLEWAAGTNIVVDWQSIRAAKVGRMTPAQLIARGRTLSEAMDALVEPLGLAWRVHDAATLQVSTKEKIDARQDVEIYDLRKVLAAGVAPADLVAQIRRDTTPTLWREATGGGRMHLDPAGSCLIVLGNQATQAEVATALDGLLEQNLARHGGS